MAFGTGATPRGRDVREAIPWAGGARADVTLTQQIDIEPIPGMAALLEPNACYAIEGYLAFSSASDAYFVARLDAPRYALGTWGLLGPAVGAVSAVGSMVAASRAWSQVDATTFPRTVGGAGVGVGMGMALLGYVQTGGYGGALQLGVAQGSSKVTATVLYAGSWLVVTKIEET